MDTPSAANPRERVRHNSYTRASSRSSTSATSEARASVHNSDRSGSNLTPSPQPHLPQTQPQSLRTSHLVHRFQASNNTRPSRSPSVTTTESSRFRSPASEEPSKGSDPKPLLSATSSYLQEKLLRERKMESERSSSRLSNDRMSASLELHASQNSPARSPLEPHRPRSSGGTGDPVKKGVSLKEMEQTLTTLHKQNFDLKLELYHRREKQTALEEQCETHEAEKRDLEELNDKLMVELEMRDKAVEEAVSMIITLEARLEELLREREKDQQAHKEQMLATDSRFRRVLSTALRNEAADAHGGFDDDPPKQRQVSNESRSITRMPSFLSERSENTENLRNVYLSTHGGLSLASLPRMSEDTADGDRDAINRIASPDLSVLSESSFLSIYGKKNNMPEFAVTSVPQRPASTVHHGLRASRDRDVAEPPPDVEFSNGNPASVVAHALASTAPHAPHTSAAAAAAGRSKSHTSKASTPTKKRSGSSTHANSGSGRLNSLSELVGTNSPLQRLEKMELSLQAMNDASRPASQEDPTLQMDPVIRQLRAHETGKPSAKDKRDSLRRVRTDAPFAGDMGNSHNLPPTPDTISTSTLRRYKNSNDTLSHEKGTSAEKSYLALSDTTTSRSGADEQLPPPPQLPPVSSDRQQQRPSVQPASTTAFNSRRQDVDMRGSYFDNRLQIPPRPRSADETTLSYHGRGSVWGDSESSDEDMEIDGNDSASMHDYWLRESLRPAGDPRGGRSRKHGRISPDLFHFPATSNGWATTAMFGTLSGQGYLGSMGSGSAPFAQALDALGDSLPTPANGVFGSSGLLASPLPYSMSTMPSGPPPPPNRRSSLHAQTGPAHGGLVSYNSGSRSGSRQGSAGGTPVLPSPSFNYVKGRRSPTRGLSSLAMPESGSQDKSARPPTAVAEDQTANAQKQRHYPPTAASNGATNRSSRVLSLFRRSNSHDANSTTPVEPSSAPATETTFAAAAASKNGPAPVIGVPSRVRRPDLDDEGGGTSATPPPIMRNPRMSARGSVDSGSSRATAAAASGNGSAEPEMLAVSAAAAHDAAPTATTPTTPAATQSPQAQGQQEDANAAVAGSATRKKWLGFGRVTSLRTRAG